MKAKKKLRIRRNLSAGAKTLISVALKQAYKDTKVFGTDQMFYGTPNALNVYLRQHRLKEYVQLMDLVGYQGRGRNDPNPWASRPAIRRKRLKVKRRVLKKRPLSIKPK